ncbi:MAG: tetratricopeptide repeat protein, partial [Calditrichaeota bacterium]|nr:tetratricopeptide repeat protein [Calditrichota bacterium]
MSFLHGAWGMGHGVRHFDPYYLLVVCILLFGVPDAARAQYTPERSYQFLEEAFTRNEKDLRDYLIRDIDDYLVTFPYSPYGARLLRMLGKIHEQEGRESKAIAAYLKAFYLFPQDPAGNETTSALRRMIATEKKYAEKRSWLDEYITTVTLDSSRANNLFRYLNLLIRIHDDDLYPYTLENAREFIRLFPGDPRVPEVMLRTAQVHRDAGEHQIADIVYLKFKMLFPVSPLLPYVLYEQGLLHYQKLRDPGKALEIFNRLISQYPDSTRSGDAMFMIAEIREEKQNSYLQAIDDYRKFVDTYPQHPKAAEALMRIARLKKDKLNLYTEAIEALQEILAKYPENPRGAEALEEIADIYKSKLHDYREAAAALADIAERYPAYEKAPERLYDAGALCERELDDRQLAMHYYEMVLIKFPGNDRAKDAAKRIEKFERER